MGTEWDAKICLEVGSSYECNNQDWIQIYYSMISKYVKIVTSFSLNNIFLFVSYNDVVSVYDLSNEKW